MPSMPRRLECAETWAGNERTASLVELPGLVAWVHSVPAGPGEAGGDVHYVSVCPSCIVSRIALADVSGHGPSKALLSAIEMGAFTELSHGPLHFDAVSGRLGLHPRSARDFLDTLVALGSLQRVA